MFKEIIKSKSVTVNQLNCFVSAGDKRDQLRYLERGLIQKAKHPQRNFIGNRSRLIINNTPSLLGIF